MNELVRFLWVVAIGTFLLGVASKCAAQCDTAADRMSQITVDGAEGVFVLQLDFACLILDIEAHSDQVVALEQRLDLEIARVSRLREAVSHGDDAIADLRSAFDLSIRRAIDAEDGWPAIVWFAIGAVVAGALELALVLVSL